MLESDVTRSVFLRQRENKSEWLAATSREALFRLLFNRPVVDSARSLLVHNGSLEPGYHQCDSVENKVTYYVDKSVLVENRPLVKFIPNYIRDSSGVFSMSSLVRISMTSFPALTLLFAQEILLPI